MSARPSPPSRVVLLLLRFLPLGEERDDVQADLVELFEVRRQKGRVHAYWRLLQDLVSLVKPRESAVSPALVAERARGIPSWLVDLRYGLRLFRKHPAVIGAAVGGLALAIGVATTVFTILNAGALRPYGMDDPGSVVRVQMLFTRGMSNTWPYHAFATLREEVRQAQLVASFEENVRVSRSAEETPARADSLRVVSGEYLQVLGGRAVLGRTLVPSDDEPGAQPVVVVNHRFWTSRLDGDRTIVGRTVWLSGTPVTVVGVIEPSFTGPADKPPAFWAPFASYGAIFRDRPIDRTSRIQVMVLGRVAGGAGRAAAEDEVSAIAAALPDVAVRTESGGTMPVTGARLDGAASPMDGPDSAGLLVVVSVILLIAGLVVALACANVANLLLAGAAARGREIAVRLALGASRRRVLRQLLSESLLIGLAAGGAGLVLSLWLVPIVTLAIGLPDTYDVRPDTTVVLFTVVISVLAGTAAGLAPARYGSRGDLLSVLKSQGPQTGSPPKAARMRRLFVGFQAAASIVLLVTAALFLRGALHIVRVDLGFDADRLAVVEPVFPTSGFDVPAATAYWRTASDRVRAIPSVENTALALYVPLGSSVSVRTVSHLERGGVEYRIYENRTDADYFAAAGFRLVRGRPYTADEVRSNAPVAVVSESVVRDFFRGTEPIGASLSAVSKNLAAVTVVGVVREALTARMRGLGNGAIYRPLPPADVASARLVVRAGDPAAIVRSIEQALLAADARVRPTTTLVRDDVNRAMNEPKVLAGLSGAVASLALVLAVLGLYGVTTFVVGQRMWEMHVRQAIGASTGDIVKLLVRQSLTSVLIGLSVGLAIALSAVRILTPALSGVSPYDPVSIAGAVLVLFGAALAAVLSPALRAAKADPAVLAHQR